MLRLQTISIIRNEEDIIEASIRHHASVVERFWVTLHRSTDGTKSILEGLQREGLPITMRESAAEGYPQSDLITALLRQSEREFPDYILVLDADEFLSAETDVRSALASVPHDVVTLLPWKTYVPSAESAKKHASLRITHRRTREVPQYHKLLIPGSRAPCITRIETGAHSFLAKEDIPAIVSTNLFLSHFPVRSEVQLRAKIIQGWESHLQNHGRKPGENYHWERLYARCLNPAPLSASELEHIAACYAYLGDEAPSLVCDPMITPL